MQSSWILSLLSGDLKPEYLSDPDILEQMFHADYIVEDADDLWKKQGMQASFMGANGQPDEKLFRQEYETMVNLYKGYELGKTIEAKTPKYEDGGKIAMKPTNDSIARGGTGVTQEQAAGAFRPMVDRSQSAYQSRNLTSPNSKSNMLDLFTPEEIGYFQGKILDEETNKFRPRTFMDKMQGMQVVKNKEGFFEVHDPKDGLDLHKALQNGEVAGTIGVLGPRSLHSGDSGVFDRAGTMLKYLSAGVYNTLLGVGKGVNESLMAGNSATNLTQQHLEDVNSWFVSQAYRPAEDHEKDPLSLGGAAWMIPNTIAQIGTAMGSAYAMSKMGVKNPNVIKQTVATGLTLYGANEMFHTARTYGLNDKSAALVYMGSLLALYGTNQITGYLTKSFMPAQLKDLARKVYKEALDPTMVAKIEAGIINEAAAAKVVRSTWAKYLNKEVMIGAAEEAAQEGLEASVDLGNQGAAHYLAELGNIYGIETGSLSKEGKQMFDENFKPTAITENILSSILYGGVGGAAGGMVNTFAGREEKAPDLLKFLAEAGDGDFEANYNTMKEVLQQDYEKGSLASTKVGFNRGSKKTEAVTDKNRDNVLTLNEFFYKSQLMDLENAKNAWDNSGINDVKDFFPKVTEELDYFEQYKLNGLQKSLAKRKVQQQANKYLLKLTEIDNKINALLAKRKPTDSPETAQKTMTTLEGGKGTTEEKKTTKKNKDKSGKTKATTRTVKAKDYEVTRNQSLEGQREYYLNKIQEIRSGEVADELIQQVLVETQLEPVVNSEGKPQSNFRAIVDAFKKTTYHRPVDQFNNVNATMQYAVEQELKRVEQQNAEQDGNYQKTLEHLANFNLPPIADPAISDHYNIPSGDAFESLLQPLQEWVNKSILYGLKPSEKNTITAYLQDYLTPLITASKANMDQLEAEEDPEFEHAYHKHNFLSERLAELSKLVADTKEVPKAQLDPRNSMTQQLYLKDIAQAEYSFQSRSKGRSMKGYNFISGDRFLNDLLTDEETKALNDKDEYTQTGALYQMLDSINMRLAQVALNASANRKANEIRDNVLSELVDLQEAEMSSVEKLLALKDLQQKSKEANIGASQNKPIEIGSSSDFTSLTLEEARLITAALNGMKQRVATLITYAENNQPSYDKVRLKEDIRFAWLKAEKIRSIINPEDDQPNFLELDDALKVNLDKLLIEIQSKAENQFENKTIIGNEAKLVSGTENSQLYELMANLTEVDYQLHQHLKQADPYGQKMALYRPLEPNQMDTKNSSYVYLKSLASLNPYAFMEAWEAETQAGIKSGHNASYMQLDVARTTVGLLLHRDQNLAEEYNKKILQDQVFITGIQGSGKTTQVAKVAINIWERLTGDTERINPAMQDEVLSGFISNNNQAFFTPLIENNKTVYAKYKDNPEIPVLRATKDVTEKEIQSWGTGYKKASITQLTKDKGKPLTSIKSGDYFYVSNQGNEKKIYVIGNSIGFGNNTKVNLFGVVDLIKSGNGKPRILAASKYKLQAKKLENILGSGTRSLESDNQTEAVVELLENAVAENKGIDQDLIVYDEATLISPELLIRMNKALFAYNQNGLYEKQDILRSAPLKVLYLGDVKQVGENNALKGNSKPRLTKDPVSGDRRISEEVNHSYVIDRTDELSFTFRSGVKGIFDTVKVYREQKYNNDEHPDFSFQSTYYLGDKKARGLQFASQEEKTTAINKFLNTLPEENRVKVAYIIGNLPDHEIEPARTRISDEFKLLPTQIMTVSQAQGQEFDYTIVDLEREAARLDSMDDIVNKGLESEVVSAVGRSTYFSLFVTSEDKKTMRSRSVRQINDVEQYKKVETVQADRDQYANSLKNIVETNKAKIVLPQPAQMEAMEKGGGISDVDYNEAQINAALAPYRGKVGSLDKKTVTVSFMDESNTIPLTQFNIPFTTNSEVIAQFEFMKDEGNGQTGVMVAPIIDGAIIPDAEGADGMLSVSQDENTGWFLKKKGDIFHVQRIEKIMQHDNQFYIFPVGAISTEDITVTTGEMDLKENGVGHVEHQPGALGFAILDNDQNIQVGLITRIGGKYNLKGKGDTIELDSDNFTLAQLTKALDCSIAT